MHDVIVIGGGPGGALAALRLAEAGARVLLLEKAALPRDKACGGALTAVPVAALLDWDLSALIEANPRTTLIEMNGRSAVERDQRYGAWMVNRRDFDMALVERAAGHGVDVRDGQAVATIDEDATGVTVTGKNGARYAAYFLIGADGATGPSAAALGLARRTPMALAVDAEIAVTEPTWSAERARMRFDFGCVPGGYGWVFPKRDMLSCGIAVWGRPGRIPALLDRYLDSAIPREAIVRQVRRGHPIPVYEGPARIATRRACLVGDAAGLVDPILGEGIRYALASGAIAAEIVARALEDGRDCRDYSQRVHAEIGRDLDALRRFVMPMFLERPATFFDSFFARKRSYVRLARALAARAPGAGIPAAA